ncbi:hypothetical protein J120_00310 [candidate division TM6 bacterium JCVI TM6SC1]|uniref:Uncharacterized protein n=1 Tax=candidate division TM6 bacterium JCVI TM6SC1 TaxID=1306947 RepID=A0A0D2I2J0_9BACT|nr:hypothetical protein J120_00310 [candidate division TM6 bacterium JCVI TM6SC1]
MNRTFLILCFFMYTFPISAYFYYGQRSIAPNNSYTYLFAENHIVHDKYDKHHIAVLEKKYLPVSPAFLVEDIFNYPGSSPLLKNYFKVFSEHQQPVILNKIAQLDSHVINMECRHAKVAFANQAQFGLPDGMKEKLKTLWLANVDALIESMENFNDGPILTKYYRKCLGRIKQAHNYIKKISFEDWSELVEKLEKKGFGLLKKCLGSADDMSVTAQEALLIYDAALFDIQVLHYIYINQLNCLKPQPIIVCAGGSHIARIAHVLCQLDYTNTVKSTPHATILDGDIITTCANLSGISILPDYQSKMRFA